MLGYVLWGACEVYARDDHRALAGQIIDSGMLLRGHLGLIERAMNGKSEES